MGNGLCCYRGFFEIVWRLRLIQEVLEDLRQHPEYCEDISPRYVLEYPEYAETLLALGQTRWEARQVFMARLQKGWAHRQELGQQWLQLLKHNLSAYKYRLEKPSLTELQKQAAALSPDLPAWAELHTKLDKPMPRLNRVGVNSVGKDQGNQ